MDKGRFEEALEVLRQIDPGAQVYAEVAVTYS